MSKGDFKRALQDAEAVRMQQSLPSAAERRLRQKLEKAYDRRQTRWVLRLGQTALIAAAVAAFVVYVVRPAVAPEADSVHGFELAANIEVEDVLVPVVGGDGVRVLQGPTSLLDVRNRMEIVAAGGTQLLRESRGVRVVSGTAQFDVDKRQAGEAKAVVLVSHGAIEVLGTEFTVTQRESGGEVTLHEGRIQFQSQDGQTVTMAPGDTLSWPLPELPAHVQRIPEPLPEAPVAEAPIAEAPKPAAPQVEVRRPPVSDREPVAALPKASIEPQQPAFDVEGFIEEVSVLRRRGAFDQAAEKLQAALREPLAPATAELLSYELGGILTYQLKDTSRACAVWREHREAHPEGRYAAQVQRAEESLGCAR